MRPLALVSALVVAALGGCHCGPDGSPPVEALALVTTSLPDGRVGAPYAAALTAHGGRAPYAFRGGWGELPPGLSLHQEGGLDGSPTTDGQFDFGIVVEDARGDRVLGSLTVLVEPDDDPPLALRLVTAELPTGDVGEPYDAPLQAEGGTAPYTWTIQSGLLPDGLVLDADAGRIVGTPATPGLVALRVMVLDAAGESRERDLELRVVPAPVLTTELFPIGVVGEPYQAQLEVSGGAWPLVYEAYSGRLPEGLELHPSGLVAGTPTAVDSRPIRFRVTDAAGVVRERRIRVWIVDDQPTEAWPDTVVPSNCGRQEPIVVAGVLHVDDPAMIARVQVAVDVDYANVGMLEFDIVGPDGTRVPLHVGGSQVGGGVGLHFMFETDRISWGSFLPLIGLGPRGAWALEVRVLPDPGFGCVPDPGRLQRFAVVIGANRSGDDYLRLLGVTPNNMIDGAFARVSGGGLPQDTLDLVVEQWSTGDNGVPEGGTGDDVLLGVPALVWTSDLPEEVGLVSTTGHFQSGGETGQGTLSGTLDDISVDVPIKIVAPDWVP